MTSYRTLLMLCTMLKYAQSQHYALTYEPRDDAWDTALSHFDQPNEIVPPKNQYFPVKFVFILETINLDEYNSLFTVTAWGQIEWYDERLTLKTADHNDSKQFPPSCSIWKPRLQLLNSVYDNDVFDDEYKDCEVKKDGRVVCYMDTIFKTFCTANSINWPYDMQRCFLRFHKDSKEAIQFLFAPRFRPSMDPALLPDVISPNDEEIGDFEYLSLVENEDSSLYIVDFEFLKSSYPLVLSVVVPSVTVAVLTLISSFVDPTSFLRLGLLYFSLVSHFILIGAIKQFVPKQGAETPIILIFVEDSTVVTLTSILYSYFLRMMLQREIIPFKWVTCIIRNVMTRFGNYLMFPGWHVNFGSSEIEANDEVWTFFTKVVDNCCVAIIVIAYMVLYTYIPCPIYKELYEADAPYGLV